MNVRHLVVAVALLATPFAVSAQQWVEGRHYQAVPNPEAPREDGKITVSEFFWYGCPSCFAFEPHLNDWLKDKPADVEFNRYAASLAQGWRLHARAYYTAESLGIVDQVHGAMFEAIHQDRNPLSSPEAIAEVFADAAGVDTEAFQSAFDSFGVETRLRRGDQLARRYQLTGVPTVIVNGKWISSPTMAQGYGRMAALIEHLVELERAAMPERAAVDPTPTPANDAPAQSTPTAQPAEALETSDEPPADSATAMWWVWLLVIGAAVVFVVIGTRRNKKD